MWDLNAKIEQEKKIRKTLLKKNCATYICAFKWS